MRISDWSSDVCSSDLRASSQGGCYAWLLGHERGLITNETPVIPFLRPDGSAANIHHHTIYGRDRGITACSAPKGLCDNRRLAERQAVLLEDFMSEIRIVGSQTIQKALLAIDRASWRERGCR